MKILHTVHGFPAEMQGGTEQYVTHVVSAQADRGHEAVVLAGSLRSADPPDLIEEIQNDVRVFRYRGLNERRLHWSEFHDPAAEALFRGLLETLRPELLHVHHWIGLTSRLVTVGAELGIPAVVTLHDTWSVCPRIFRLKDDLAFCLDPYKVAPCMSCAPRASWEIDAVREALLAERRRHLAEELRRARRLIVPSAAHQHLLARISGLGAERFTVLPHPSLTRLPRGHAEEAGPLGRPLRIGCWGSLLPHKGQDVLVRALPLLPVTPPWEVHIFGSPEDPEFEATLKRLAEGYPVTFHGEYRPEDLTTADLDLGVFPSLAPESFSFTLDEALQLGLPVVVSDRGALAERAGDAALVVPAGDPQALALALRRILTDPTCYAELRAAALVRRPCDLDAHLESLERVYRETLRAHPELVPAPTLDRLHTARYQAVLHLERMLEEYWRAHAALQAQHAELQERSLAREAALTAKAADLALQLDAERRHRVEVETVLQEITRSRGWRALTLFRTVKTTLLAPRRAWWTLRMEGWRSVLRKASRQARQVQAGVRALFRRSDAVPVAQAVLGDIEAHQEWLRRHALTAERLEAWRVEAGALPWRPLISLVVPVHNVAAVWLCRAIESVLGQVYDRWELCLVNDASTLPHVAPILEEYAGKDPRIRVKHLPVNQGIAGASNEGLAMATGEFLGFLDHDDELPPHALYRVASHLNLAPDLDLLYTDEDKIDANGRRFAPFFKPDWSPDLLRSMNYICHLTVIRAGLLRELGGFRPGFEGSQDYDLVLRATERTARIAHIPDVLYHWRALPLSAAANVEAKPHAFRAAVRALTESIARLGREGRVEMTALSRYVVRYRIKGSPLVSIIIPMRDRAELTHRCLTSVESRTAYRPYEILLIDNESTETASLDFLERMGQRHRVLRYARPFNFSAINNFGAEHAHGDYLVFLNNDTEVRSGEWLGAMLEHAQWPEVGAVGAKLLYPDGRIQHAGVFIIGTPTAVAGHAFKFSPAGDSGYMGFIDAVRNCSAVTAACMMVRREVFEAVGGFDEAFRVAFGDVDFCLRLRERGYLIVYTPLATLYHHESASRGTMHPPEDDRLFRDRWRRFFEGGRDPYWNPHLSVESELPRLRV